MIIVDELETLPVATDGAIFPAWPDVYYPSEKQNGFYDEPKGHQSKTKEGRRASVLVGFENPKQHGDLEYLCFFLSRCNPCWLSCGPSKAWTLYLDT